jgi:hypothetical protein
MTQPDPTDPIAYACWAAQTAAYYQEARLHRDCASWPAPNSHCPTGEHTR